MIADCGQVQSTVHWLHKFGKNSTVAVVMYVVCRYLRLFTCWCIGSKVRITAVMAVSNVKGERYWVEIDLCTGEFHMDVMAKGRIGLL